MTHTRNTPASRDDEHHDRPRDADEHHDRPRPPRDADEHHDRAEIADRDDREYPTDSDGVALDPNGEFDERSLRARTEAMHVLALGSGRYAVHSESGNDYLVDVLEGSCTCPDHSIRGVRCKHLRRVAIEITAGSVVPPSYVASTCASCGGFALVPPGAREPHLCVTHALAVGDRAFDPVTEEVVLVVSVSPERAVDVQIPGTDVTVAEYETNADYPASDPVVAAVYPAIRVDADGPRPESLRVYSFPVSRLERLEDAEDRSARDRGRFRERTAVA